MEPPNSAELLRVTSLLPKPTVLVGTTTGDRICVLENEPLKNARPALARPEGLMARTSARLRIRERGGAHFSRGEKPGPVRPSLLGLHPP
jgi:hypothetical protein